MSRERASGPSTHVLAPGNIVLASDVAVLSKPNGSIRLVANKPCGNWADGGDGGRGMLSLGAVPRPLCYLSVVAAVLGCGAVGPSPVACPTRGVDRAAKEGPSPAGGESVIILHLSACTGVNTSKCG